MHSDPLFVVTPGDPEGIGPEVFWKSLHTSSIQKRILCVGSKTPFLRQGAPIVEVFSEGDFIKIKKNNPQNPTVYLLAAPEKKTKSLPGFQSGWSIEAATRLALSKSAAAIITGPISKDRLQKGGYAFPGHTEFLAHLCKSRSVTMMLANEKLRVTLVTTHQSLQSVPRSLTRAKIRACVLNTVQSLRRGWGISHPRVAIAALNPHAGEGGIFGKEELRVIAPETASLRKKLKNHATLIGPLPADTLFANHIVAPAQKRYDAVVCMYHDQGLIPVKLLDFPNTVNITLGLPIIRTSVDHGVGFDIVGQNKADPSSMRAAIALAARLHSSTIRRSI